MRRWLRAWIDAVRHVADRPGLWIPGALAWTAGWGWLPLVVAVARPPTDADLTFFGAGIFTSGSWPWNAILIVAVGLAVVSAGVGFVALGESVLVASASGRGPTPGDVGRTLAILLVAAIPAAVIVVLTGAMAIVVAPDEFRRAAEGGGPVLRTLLRLAPFLVALVVSAVLATALSAAASRLAVASGAKVGVAIGRAPRQLAGLGGAGLAQSVANWVVRIVALALATVLLRVLWAPIGQRLDEGARFDAAIVLLLVGFVAVWLCLVLGGGALHAWSSVTWSRLLAPMSGHPARPRQPANEGQPNR